jgi:hypothetical protein
MLAGDGDDMRLLPRSMRMTNLARLLAMGYSSHRFKRISATFFRTN